MNSIQEKKFQNKIETIEVKSYPLKSIDISSTIYDSHALTIVSQEYINDTENSEEVEVNIFLGKETILRSLTATIDDKIMKSKIYEKETAKEKYSDSISSGNTAVIADTNEENQDYLTLAIGNLFPKKKLILKLELINLITSEDLSSKFCFPMERIPLLVINKKTSIRPHFESRVRTNVNTESNIQTDYVPITFSAVYISPSKITRLISKNHKSLTNFSEDKKIGNLSIHHDEIKNNSNIEILFRNEDLNLMRVYEEFSQHTNEFSYSMRYKLDERTYPNLEQIDTDETLNYYNLYEAQAINDTPSSFIFLLDQSGSMRGDPINTAKEALKLFIMSLPHGSEFMIIGFGTNYKDYTKVQPYDKKSVQDALKLIDSLKADLHETNIFAPLQYAFSLGDSAYKNNCRNVFLLTDGCVSNSQMCVDLIEKNNKQFRVHALGIGKGVSRPFINQCGSAGKGSAEFAVELKEITRKVIKALNSALKVYYYDFKVGFSNEIKSELCFPSLISNSLIYQDELFSYSFITKEKLDPDCLINLAYSKVGQSEKIEKQIKLKDLIFSLNDDDVLNKFIAGSICSHEKESGYNQNEISNISKKYQVISAYTSLFAELEMEESQTSELMKVIIPISKNKVPVKSNNRNIGINPVRHMYSSGARPMSAMVIKEVVRSPMMPQMAKQTLGSVNMKAKKANVDSNERKKQANAPSQLINLGDYFEAELNQEESEEIFIEKKTGKHGSGGVRFSQNKIMESNVQKEKEKVESSSNNNLENKKKKKEEKRTPDSKIKSYSSIVSCQQFDGSWSTTNDPKIITLIITEEKENYDLLLDNLKNSELAITVLTIWYLFKNFPDSQDEYFIITNKAKKYLLNNKVDYNDISTLLK